jgi:AraC family transcriptional regulator of adaptative response/methylated-DNA-[protein]-cysteine methyltransferase
MNDTITCAYSTDDQRWQAIVERDPKADGAFIVAVRTTEIYCRPSCSSRRPNRENVLFFPTCAAAEEAGFRACKRCKPKDLAAATKAPEPILRACQLIDEAEEPPALNDLAGAVGLSPYYFHRLFKDTVGVTPKQYAAARRVQRFRNGLQKGKSVTTALYEAGYGSSSRCYEGAGDVLGMTPSHYKNGAAGQRIRFAIADSYLGQVLVAATERGLCVIEFGDTPKELRGRLTARFPKADLHDDDPDFAGWVTQVVAFLEAPRRGLNLPLDIQGTAFQQRVWKALQTIPAGSTASYTDIAEQIGRPTAVRAVAQACAANPVAVIVPCHRVLRRNGDLSGYRGGVARKRALLNREAGQTGE